MKVLIVGSGLSGLSCAINSAYKDKEVILVSPYGSHMASSSLAAGGINSSLNTKGENDTIDLHVKETLDGGENIENPDDVKGLCENAPKIIKWLTSIGTVFNRDSNGNVDVRSFGGQSKKRTCYSGALTGKMLVTALNRECMRLQSLGKIKRIEGLSFYKALIKDNTCHGVIFYDEINKKYETIYADNTVIATGGLNRLFGKTTGTFINNAYTQSMLFTQGVNFRNLEMIQYHPTAISAPLKKILISEAARGEGGRLFVLDDDGNRVYFMEEKYKRGNLERRDIVSKEMYNQKRDVYLDISFLGKKVIDEKLSEIALLCKTYINLDVHKKPIPVAPAIHYFMGGIDVDSNHLTSVNNLYAIGECSSKYHGANRLGGNSLLGAIYSGMLVGKLDMNDNKNVEFDDIKLPLNEKDYHNSFETNDYLDKSSEILNKYLGIVRCEEELLKGINEIDELIKEIDHEMSFLVMPRLIMSKAILNSALERKESRGAHFRSDYPNLEDNYKGAIITSYENELISSKIRRNW